MDARLEARTLPLPRQRWFVLGLVVVILILTVQYVHKTRSTGRSAFQRWQPQILQLYDVDIYQRYAYPNPPIMALLLTPLAHLPPMAGALAWFYTKLGMTALALYWVFLLVQSPGRQFPPWAKALIVVLSLRPIMGDLTHGNVNLLILFLVVASLYAFHRGRDLTAGLTLALSIACKVTPALFVGYFLWKRAWKALLGCAAGLVLFWWVIPGCTLGPARNAQLLTSWYRQMVEPYVVAGVVTSEHENQSLPGLVFRLATHSPSATVWDRDHYAPVEFDNFVSLDRPWARLLVKGCMLAFAGLIVLACRTPTSPRHGWRLAAEFSLVVVGMLLFSERTWKHHCVTLMLPFAVLIYYVAVCEPGPRLRAYLVGTLAAAALLMASTGAGLWKAWDEVAKRAEVYGAYVWANLILVAALVVILRRGRDMATVVPPHGLE
ncbi:MAG TPA: glycosyltransferase family 87 protein [Gemmataceae bacterium]|jgi:hypothetical protein|nr:glycosyltransferase family 87 protein [Gemmataceae bacterium]